MEIIDAILRYFVKDAKTKIRLHIQNAFCAIIERDISNYE